MVKRVVLGLMVCVLVGVSGASADLLTIGTASYDGGEYNLLYEDTQNLVWLDYAHERATWQNQRSWAAGLGSDLAVTLNPGYASAIDWSAGWRLPETVDNLADSHGFNVTTSEMGHLYYESLGLEAIYSWSSDPLNTDSDLHPFDNLLASLYWSDTQYAAGYDYAPGVVYAWCFEFRNGSQGPASTTNVSAPDTTYYGLAVHEGSVSVVPVPGAALLGLLGLGAAAARLRRPRTS